MIEHWSNTLLSVEEMRPPCCSVDVSNGSSAQLQDDIHIPEVYVQDKHALMQTRFGHSRQTEAAPSCSIVSCKETWSHLHFQALLFFFFYLLGGERLRPVVQNEPVFVEGFGLCRRFFALLPVCDFAVFIHGWDGPPATVGRGNMVGRRHDRAFCACGGEERGGRGWRESVCERERERASEQEREREKAQRLERSSITGSRGSSDSIHQFGTAPRFPGKKHAHPNPYANTDLLEHAAVLAIKSMGNITWCVTHKHAPWKPLAGSASVEGQSAPVRTMEAVGHGTHANFHCVERSLPIGAAH